jgi:beta-glucosidase
MAGKVANGDTGDVACDHYHRYAEDVALMRRLGIGAYRFSISWPRVLPRGRGRTNAKGLDFYDRLIDAVLAAGIEPWICLYHWDLPQALDDLGGWTARDSASWFADYAALVARRTGDRVRRFATFNEPNVATLFGYAFDWNAPGIRDRASYLAAAHHVNLAHGEAVAAIRELAPRALVGAIHNRQVVRPASDDPADLAATAALDVHWNRIFPDTQILGAYPEEVADEMAPYVRAGDLARICRRLDWFGLNHYSPIYCKADPANPLGIGWASPPDSADRTGIGWPIFPEAFGDELVTTHRRYGLPVYVTENGFGANEPATAEGAIDDAARIRYLEAYVSAMAKAIAAGADVRGYFVWSLLDNFEWGSGYANRFGLVHVDFATQVRTMKASAEWYRALIAAESMAEPLPA